MYDLQIFSPFLLVVFVDNDLWCTKFLNFNKVQFIYAFFCCCNYSVISNNLLPNPRHEDLFLCFLLRIYV
jgi:hypothetical protein